MSCNPFSIRGQKDAWTAISFGDRNIQLIQAEIQYGKVSITDLSFIASNVTGNINETKILSLQTIPSYATSADVSWSSSNETVAAVSKSGEVTGISAGSVIITASNASGSITTSCNIEVTETGSIPLKLLLFLG